MNILEIQNLSKTYGERKALDNVCLSVEKGAVYGLLGPNGAGKTTLLRIINSILVSDSGSVKIAGKEAELGVTSSMLGYMPEERGLYPKMRVDEQVLYFGRLKGVSLDVLRRNMSEYMDIFDIAECDRHRRVEELSKGNQQKVQILSTIVHEPQLIILDEPFSGFDPINGQLLTNLISRLRERECTVILSSHNMPALEEMATHIALVNKGKILLDGDITDLKHANKSGEIAVTVSMPISEELALDSPAIKSITRMADNKHRHGVNYSIRPAENACNNDIILALALQANILRFEEVLPSLTDLFLKYTGKFSADSNISTIS